uniref:Uncharacterized protein n=1 Tax=Terrapene triunguis TaxID=2587831 RepID=A0A674I3Q7_9SAUR
MTTPKDHFDVPLVKDLLHSSPEEEKWKHRKKRLVQSPNSYFMDVNSSPPLAGLAVARFKCRRDNNLLSSFQAQWGLIENTIERICVQVPGPSTACNSSKLQFQGKSCLTPYWSADRLLREFSCQHLTLY